MLISTFDISTSDDKFRQEHHIPLSLIVSPCEELKNQINLEPEFFPRCKFCNAYFSSFCSKIDDNKWICSLCGKEQSYDFNKFIKTNQINENIWFNLNKKTKTTNEKSIISQQNEILVFYISLEFHQNDLNIIKPLFSQYLYKHKNHNCIFILSQIDGEITLLCPDYNKFDINNGNLINKDLNTKEENKDNSLKSIEKNENQKDSEEFCASFQKYSSISMINLKNHIFTPDQIELAANAINLLQNSSAYLPFTQITLSANFICEQLYNENIRFIAIIPSCNIPAKSKNILIDTNLDKLKTKNARIDILIPQFDQKVQIIQNHLPGIFVPFSRYDLPSKLEYILNHTCEYQVYMNVRNINCEVQWHKTPLLQQEIDGKLLFTQTCFEHQPFVLDVKNITNGEKECLLQITIKTNDKFIILNKKIILENDFSKISKTINLKALQWIWLTRAIGKPGSLQAVKEAALAVSFFLKSTNLSEDKNITESGNQLQIFISNIDNYHCFKNDISLTILYLSITHPNYVTFIPTLSIKEKKKIAFVLNEIYANGSSHELTKKIKEIGICGDISSCIPEWFK